MKPVFRSLLALGIASFVVPACGSSERHGDRSNGAAATGGSGGSSPGGGAGGQSEGAAAFCPRWLDEFASFMQRCMCDAAAVQRYREVNAVLCEPGGYF